MLSEILSISSEICLRSSLAADVGRYSIQATVRAHNPIIRPRRPAGPGADSSKRSVRWESVSIGTSPELCNLYNLRAPHANGAGHQGEAVCHHLAVRHPGYLGDLEPNRVGLDPQARARQDTGHSTRDPVSQE